MTVHKVYEAINHVQTAIAKLGIAKDRKNQQQGYNFRGIDDVYNALAPQIAEAKLCILPRVMSRECVERQSQKGGALFSVVVDMEFDFVSAEDGSKHTVRVVGEAMDSADKASSKAMSAAYKYAAMQTFCIPTEGDNDADAMTYDVKHAVPKPVPNLTPVPKTIPEAIPKKGPSLSAALARVRTASSETLDGAINKATEMFAGSELTTFQAAIAARRTVLTALALIDKGAIDEALDLKRSLPNDDDRKTVDDAVAVWRLAHKETAEVPA